MGSEPEWTWCTIIVVIILVVLLLLMVVGGTCGFAFYIRVRNILFRRGPCCQLETSCCPKCESLRTQLPTMWNWCTILLLIILIMFLVIVIIAASCFCAINIKKGNDRRNPPSDLYPFPMDLYPTSQRSFVAPPRDNRIESTAPVTYSQQSMPMLTPYQQYIIAQNWSNLYRAYQQNQNQGMKQKT